MAKYINPYTDFGFKKLFGEEANKDLLIDFLNELLPKHHKIHDLTFKNVEQMPDASFERKAIFDIHCIAESGERFIVEMQKAKINFFKDRALFYVTFPIREQAHKGDWDFELSPVYMVAILDFKYDEKEEKAKLLRHVQLKDQDCEVFFEKLHFKFLQMPYFAKEAHELETHFDKWIYFLKGLESFDDIPTILKEPIFEKAFKIAEVANMTSDQRKQYEESRMSYLGVTAAVNTAFSDGEIKGKIEGEKIGEKKGELKAKLTMAQSMIAANESLEKIILYTGLTAEDIEKL